MKSILNNDEASRELKIGRRADNTAGLEIMGAKGVYDLRECKVPFFEYLRDLWIS